MSPPRSSPAPTVPRLARIQEPVRERLDRVVEEIRRIVLSDFEVQAEVNDLLERRLSPNPLVTIHKYPGADHAFARYGGKTYSKPEADRALALTLDFFRKHLGGA